MTLGVHALTCGRVDNNPSSGGGRVDAIFKIADSSSGGGGVLGGGGGASGHTGDTSSVARTNTLADVAGKMFTPDPEGNSLAREAPPDVEQRRILLGFVSVGAVIA